MFGVLPVVLAGIVHLRLSLAGSGKTRLAFPLQEVGVGIVCSLKPWTWVREGLAPSGSGGRRSLARSFPRSAHSVASVRSSVNPMKALLSLLLSVFPKNLEHSVSLFTVLPIRQFTEDQSICFSFSFFFFLVFHLQNGVG